MKRAILSISILLFSIYSFSQVPESFDYLAVINNTPGNYSQEQAKNIYIIGFNESLGGYVFYVTPDGKHGLVAATQDQSASCDWYSAQDSISNPDNHNADGKKFLDWRLPTKFELNLMYAQKTQIGGFVNNFYWSSILNGSNYAWVQNFSNGSQDYGSRDGAFHVRAVRSY
jgi:hypothetical protein